MRARSVRRPWPAVQGRVSRSLRAVGAAGPRRCVFHSVGASDPLEAVRCARADRRRAARHAGRVDRARRPARLQDEAQRRQPRPPTSSASSRIDRVVTRVQAARRVPRLEVPPRLQRGLPERRVPDRGAAAGARGDAARLRARSSTSSSPRNRDLKKDRANVMHAAARLRPVVVDESLTDLETLLLAREMGYTGVALKACKGQTHAMLMAAAAQKFGMFLCVQDLTCPGASLIHSAGIAARVPGNAGIEANARQFVPGGQRAVGGAISRAVHHPRRPDADGPVARARAWRRGPEGTLMPMTRRDWMRMAGGAGAGGGAGQRASRPCRPHLLPVLEASARARLERAGTRHSGCRIRRRRPDGQAARPRPARARRRRSAAGHRRDQGRRACRSR